jgi:HEPN domain-containing protein
MSGDERADARRWLQFAADDLAAAKTIHADRHLPHRLTCFHCQQSVEKALKAVLIRLKIDFPKTHDLNLLRSLLPKKSRVKREFSDFSDLMVFAVQTRYPGDFPDATDTDASDAIVVAERLLEAVRPTVEK